MFCVALASLVLATSCSQDDLQTAKFSQNPINLNAGLGGQPISTFAAAKGKAVKSRAVETTITNLGSFTMNAFQDGETNYMKDVKYTSTDGSVWNTDAGTFYWPVEGNLHFYAYAPEQPGQLEAIQASLNSYLGYLGHYKSYKIIHKSLTGSAVFKHLYFASGYKKSIPYKRYTNKRRERCEIAHDLNRILTA